LEFELDSYGLNAVTEGTDAQGEVLVKIKREQKLFNGRGLSTDVIEASVNAYLNAINKMYDEIRQASRKEAEAEESMAHE